MLMIKLEAVFHCFLIQNPYMFLVEFVLEMIDAWKVASVLLQVVSYSTCLNSAWKMVTHVGHILHSQACELFNRSFADSIPTFLQQAPECVR